MKKLISATLLVGGFAVAGGAFAQATACTNAVGPYADPACSGPPSSVWTGDGYAYTGPGARHYPYYGNQAQVAPHIAVPYGLVRGVNPRDLDGDGIRNRRDRDRDGDGVRNNRDRHPDDPRFR